LIGGLVGEIVKWEDQQDAASANRSRWVPAAVGHRLAMCLHSGDDRQKHYRGGKPGCWKTGSKKIKHNTVIIGVGYGLCRSVGLAKPAQLVDEEQISAP
jgi:hypothetical protein